jgi:hypothetical protein
MNSVAEKPVTKTTVVRKAGKPKLRHVQIEPADNGYTVHTSTHNDYMEPSGPKKPKVFEKKHGHEMLKHVARKLGIKAKIEPVAETDTAEPDEDGDE